MVTLVPPFPKSIPDDRLVQAFDRVVEDPGSHNPNVPDPVRDVILKSMSSDPRERYQAPWEMIDALQEAREAASARLVMSLLVTGSIGIDTVTSPHGYAESVLGGSAVYFSFAA